MPDKLGHGAFGSVYIAHDKINNTNVAIKCESKEKNENLTLLREFKVCKKIYDVKKYLKCVKQQEDDTIGDTTKISNNTMILESNPTIIVYNHISKNNLLSIPTEFNINLLINTICIPETHKYFACTDYNYLTMELCGDNIESILEKYSFSEKSKYSIAYRLLYIMSCIHRCGIIHRDIKLSNFVLNKKIDDTDNNILTQYDNLSPIVIDLGLAKEYYKFEGGKAVKVAMRIGKSITGTLRYISLNIHEFKSPTVVDDLISLSYALIVIFTGKTLPWVGHRKDIDKFEIHKHTQDTCKCGYHKFKAEGITKHNNTIADVKFHTDLDELVGKYSFLATWIRYLYSLNFGQLPSYNILLKKLKIECNDCDDLVIELEKKTKIRVRNKAVTVVKEN
ncbi:MAG: serine/threonine protein kinase [Gaeavirus sp.]|uniref:non-specific serine/threonine protein kinase n=1 Tax=Gaeavirus sp. TaxID=2487767 RepID=A0A3G4ZYY1_9VIRU|nr:MAG: serine/threonine protein kinase [Gaeavirus sp.]